MRPKPGGSSGSLKDLKDSLKVLFTVIGIIVGVLISWDFAVWFEAHFRCK